MSWRDRHGTTNGMPVALPLGPAEIAWIRRAAQQGLTVTTTGANAGFVQITYTSGTCAAAYADYWRAPAQPVWDETAVRALDRRTAESAFRAAGWPESEWPERRRQAEEKADRLLHRFLTEEQQSSLLAAGWFGVRGQEERNEYRIHRGGYRNVVQWRTRAKTGKAEPYLRYCLHPVEWCPAADAMLAQKLLIETDEADFLRRANPSAVAGVFWM